MVFSEAPFPVWDTTLGSSLLAALAPQLVYLVFLCWTSHVLFKLKSMEERVSVNTSLNVKAAWENSIWYFGQLIIFGGGGIGHLWEMVNHGSLTAIILISPWSHNISCQCRVSEFFFAVQEWVAIQMNMSIITWTAVKGLQHWHQTKFTIFRCCLFKFYTYHDSLGAQGGGRVCSLSLLDNFCFCVAEVRSDCPDLLMCK